MNLRKFTSELVKAWRSREKKPSGLSGIKENKETGIKGEKYVLRKLKREYPDYQFCRTDYSWSPADIIGLKKGVQFWHFAMFQVKTSVNKYELSPEINEKETLPVLAKLLKEVFVESKETNYYKKKPLYITTGFIGVHFSSGRFKLQLKVPYKKDFSKNKLSLTNKEKSGIKNFVHQTL